MLAATDRHSLLTVHETEFAKLSALIAGLGAGQAVRKRDGDTSIKDVIAHRAPSIDLFLGWYRDGQAGRPVAFPAPGYTWSALKRYNADLRARQRDLGWAEARTRLASAHGRLTAFLHGLETPPSAAPP